MEGKQALWMVRMMPYELGLCADAEKSAPDLTLCLACLNLM